MITNPTWLGDMGCLQAGCGCGEITLSLSARFRLGAATAVAAVVDDASLVLITRPGSRLERGQRKRGLLRQQQQQQQCLVVYTVVLPFRAVLPRRAVA